MGEAKHPPEPLPVVVHQPCVCARAGVALIVAAQQAIKTSGMSRNKQVVMGRSLGKYFPRRSVRVARPFAETACRLRFKVVRRR
jgi:hypothetical protein